MKLAQYYNTLLRLLIKDTKKPLGSVSGQ